MKTIRNYFQDGTLPKKGTVCETESSIFGNAMDSAKSLSSEDFALLQAAEGFASINSLISKSMSIDMGTYVSN